MFRDCWRTVARSPGNFWMAARTSQTALSGKGFANRLSSNRTAATSAWTSGVRGRASHNSTLPSRLADASRIPSELNATLQTQCLWPLRVRSSWPLSTSQSFTVPSQLADASRVPSGLNATQWTTFGVPLEGARAPGHCRVPQLHRPVVTGRRQPRPVRAERHAEDIALMPLEGEEFLPAARIPELQRPITASRRQAPSVRAERHA